MKPKYWLWIFAVSFLFHACSEATTEGTANGTNKPSENDQPETTVDLCQQISCPFGCAAGTCVDFRSDVNHCGQANHKCTGQTSFCKNGMCVPDCTGDGTKICKGLCIDTTNNTSNCGRCEHHCADNMVCASSTCICADNYVDCNGNELDGCETFSDECECTPGQTQSCYTGNPATLGIGVCHAGTRTCKEGGYYDYQCKGEMTPGQEIIGNGLDDDCDGAIDEGINEDADGDGWTIAQGDCCDSYLTCKADEPAKINPGAIDETGNQIDDDCDGIIDNPKPVATCSSTTYQPVANAQVTSTDALKLAQAMDICTASTTEGYGLIQAELLHADGSPLEKTCNTTLCGSTTHISPAEQVSVSTRFGATLPPMSGSTMAVLSSGKAQGKENTSTKDCMGSEVNVPQVYLDAHGGKLPVSTICNNTRSGTKANDSIMLRLKLKAPSNAAGFKFKFKFFSKEYPGYICNDYNDFFLALLNSQHPDIPKDRNISFDSNGNPVSVNNAFFTECDKTACTKDVGCSTCEDGIGSVSAYVQDTKTAGATRWLQTSSPIMAGETFTLDLIVFDAGDFEATTSRPQNTTGWGHQRDSLVLIDNFEWTTAPTKLQTIIY